MPGPLQCWTCCTSAGLALVSSSPRAVLERGLAAHDLAAVFGSVIAGDDGFGHMPDPLPFAETLTRWGALAERALIIGFRMWIFWRGKRRGAGPAGLPQRKTRGFMTLPGLAAWGQITGSAIWQGC